MNMRIPATRNDTLAVEAAIQHLREARRLLALVGARKSLGRVRGALKSAEGARRHAQRVMFQSRQAGQVSGRAA